MTHSPTPPADSGEAELRQKIHESVAACNRRFDKTGYYEAGQMLDEIMHRVTAYATNHTKSVLVGLAEQTAEYYLPVGSNNPYAKGKCIPIAAVDAAIERLGR